MGRLTNKERSHSGLTGEKPPRWAESLLNRFSPTGLEDELQGDMLEMYAYWRQTLGLRRARWRYTLAVFRVIRPFTRSMANQPAEYAHLKRPNRSGEHRTTFYLNPDMLRNYLKIAFRNLVHNKVYSGINISGLAIGMACCLAIGLYVWDEYSFDRFHKNAKHIYRIVEKQNQAGTLYDIASSPGILAPALKADFAEIQQTCRIDRA